MTDYIENTGDVGSDSDPRPIVVQIVLDPELVRTMDHADMADLGVLVRDAASRLLAGAE
jgi:hypothetical protein